LKTNFLLKKSLFFNFKAGDIHFDLFYKNYVLCLKIKHHYLTKNDGSTGIMGFKEFLKTKWGVDSRNILKGSTFGWIDPFKEFYVTDEKERSLYRHFLVIMSLELDPFLFI